MHKLYLLWDCVCMNCCVNDAPGFELWCSSCSLVAYEVEYDTCRFIMCRNVFVYFVVWKMHLVLTMMQSIFTCRVWGWVRIHISFIMCVTVFVCFIVWKFQQVYLVLAHLSRMRLNRIHVALICINVFVCFVVWKMDLFYFVFCRLVIHSIIIIFICFLMFY